MRKGEKENLRIQLGERFYDYVEKCRKFLGCIRKNSMYRNEREQKDDVESE